MIKDIISSKQAIATIFLFIIGSTSVLGGSTDAKQASWISMIISFIAALPIVLIYARILHLYPQKDLFDIIYILFGNFFGRIIILMFTWYAIHLGSIILRDFGEFIQVAILPETPQIPLYLIFGLLAAYVVKSGVNNLGKISLILFPLFILLNITIIILSYNLFDFLNIQPFWGQGFKKIISGAFTNLSFPFAETVLFTTILNSLKNKDNKYKIFLYAIIFSGFLLILTMIKNILVLGFPYFSDSYFPSYNAGGLIVIGKQDTLARIEIIVTIGFVFAGFIKTTVCLFAASKGLAKLFKTDNYRDLAFPALLLMLALANIIYTNTMEMIDFINVYKYYALPFQIILPVIIYILAEIKSRKKSLPVS